MNTPEEKPKAESRKQKCRRLRARVTARLSALADDLQECCSVSADQMQHLCRRDRHWLRGTKEAR